MQVMRPFEPLPAFLFQATGFEPSRQVERSEIPPV
jgi:hypothetical protein